MLLKDKLLLLFISSLFLIFAVNAKSFTSCELSKELRNVYNLTEDESRNLICIAQKFSRFNTNVVGGDNYGIFQISKKYCGRKKADGECNIPCNSLLDDDISDDVSCAQKIIAKSGMRTWRIEKIQGCQKELKNLDENCPKEESIKTLKIHVNYCEFATRLMSSYDISKFDALTWSCIADHQDESSSPSHSKEKTGNVNEDEQQEAACVKKHDVECAIKIYKQRNNQESSRFINWSAYEEFCKNISGDDIEKCFGSVDEIQNKYTTSTDISIVENIQMNVKTVTHSNGEIQSSTTVTAVTHDDDGEIHASTQLSTSDDESQSQSSSTEFLSDTLDKPTSGEEEEEGDIMTDGYSKVRVMFADKNAVETSEQQQIETTTSEKFDELIKNVLINDSKETQLLNSMNKCDIARSINESGIIQEDLIPTFMCIAEHVSGLNSSLVLNDGFKSKYGLFQIDNVNYCNTNDQINECDVLCAHLIDQSFDNDLECVKYIYDKEGFDYWPSYSEHCTNVDQHEFDICYQPKTTTHIPFFTIDREFLQHEAKSTAATTTTVKTTTQNVDKSKDDEASSFIKKFDFCKFSQQLHINEKIPLEDLTNYVCIANETSDLILRQLEDDIDEIGLFGLRFDTCGFDQADGKCSIVCSSLLDTNLYDDLACVKKIYNEQGLSYWNLDNNHCSTYNSEILQCLNEGKFDTIVDPDDEKFKLNIFSEKARPQEIVEDSLAEESEPVQSITINPEVQGNSIHADALIADNPIKEVTSEKYPYKTTTEEVFYTSIKEIIDDLKNTSKIVDKREEMTFDDSAEASFDLNFDNLNETVLKIIEQIANGSTTVRPSKVTQLPSYKQKYDTDIIEKCSLVKHIRESSFIPFDLIAKLVCIAEYESSFNMSLMRSDGGKARYTRYGLFQIDDVDYCNTNDKINKCDVLCAYLLDNQFDNDLECVKRIYDKEGFKYWPTYSKHCSNVDPHHYDYCYQGTTTTHQPYTELDKAAILLRLLETTTTTTTTTPPPPPIIPKFNYTDDESRFIIRRVDLCELTHELYAHNITIDDVPNYLCIADTQSQLKIREPLDDEDNLGLFSINKEFCGDNEVGGLCKMACSDLLNDDITDDIQCAIAIYETNDVENWNLTASECKPYGVKLMDCIDNHEFQTTRDPLVPIDITPWAGFYITTEISTNKIKKNTDPKKNTAEDLRKLLQEFIIRPSEILELPKESSTVEEEETTTATIFNAASDDEEESEEITTISNENLSHSSTTEATQTESALKKITIPQLNLDLTLPKEDDEHSTESIKLTSETPSTSSEESSEEVSSQEISEEEVSTEKALTVSEVKKIVDQTFITPDQQLVLLKVDVSNESDESKEDLSIESLKSSTENPSTSEEHLIDSSKMSSTTDEPNLSIETSSISYSESTTLAPKILTTTPQEHLTSESSVKVTNKIQETTTIANDDDDDLETEFSGRFSENGDTTLTHDHTTSKIITILTNTESETTTESIFPIEILQNKNLKDQVETIVKVHSDHESLKGNSSQLVFNIFNFNINGEKHDVKYSIHQPTNQPQNA